MKNYKILLFISVLFVLIGCGSESSDENENESENLPTSSILVTSKSPEHNETNVPINTTITVTGDQSIIHEALYVQIFDMGQDETCVLTWEDWNPPCPYSHVAEFQPTSEMIQGNTLTFKPQFDLDMDTNYIIRIHYDMPDDDFAMYWRFKTGTGPNTGVFIDSPVINIGYRTETLDGVTNAQGEYKYLTGETVTFFIGNLEFPTIAASETVTPLDLASTDNILDSTVINIIRLLQSLDQDGIASNGITITDEAKSIATQIDFTLSESDFESLPTVTELLQNAGRILPNSPLVSTEQAVEHFQSQLDELEAENSGLSFDAVTLPGTYNLIFAAEEVPGVHSYIFSADGTVAITWADGESQTESWSVNNNGELVFSGSIHDIFTLTSGDQFSGNLDVILEDNDDGTHTLINTTGTIELVN